MPDDGRRILARLRAGITIDKICDNHDTGPKRVLRRAAVIAPAASRRSTAPLVPVLEANGAAES